MIAHVGQRYNSRLVYYPSYPKIDHSVFYKCDWSEFYRDAKEAITVNASELQGKEVDMCMFVDSDHAGDKVSCRSKSGFLVYKHYIGAGVLKEAVYSRKIWHRVCHHEAGHRCTEKLKI